MAVFYRAAKIRFFLRKTNLYAIPFSSRLMTSGKLLFLSQRDFK